MFEIQRSHNPTQHQQHKFDLLKYQNSLLCDRNRVLEAENQKLLQQLDLYVNALKQSNTAQGVKLFQQIANINQKAKEYLHHTLEKANDRVKIIIGSFVKQYKQSLDSEQGSFSQTFDALTKIVSKLLQILLQKKVSQAKGYINKMQQRLISRKNARDKTQKAIHFIKEPSQQLNNLSLKLLKEDINQQKELLQKIVRRVKRPEINSRCIDLIFEKVDNLMTIRWSLRKQYAVLSLIQRSFQLGQMDESSHNNTLQKIQMLKINQQDLKKSLEQDLEKLSTTCLR